MSHTIFVGRGKDITTMPRSAWEEELAEAPELIRRRLEFMSRDHHAVRNFMVRELPRFGRPITIAEIADSLDLTRARTSEIVSELEAERFFLVRRGGPGVSWAFPVTVDATTHHLVFSTGERLDAA